MIDGRFDQHFLEIYAAAQTDAKDRQPVPWISLIIALSVSVAMAVGAILLT